MRRLQLGIFLSTLLLAAGIGSAEQLADPAFKAKVDNPAYATGKKPVVLVDGGHNNWHKIDGRYKPFAEVLTADGYDVRALAGTITPEALKGIDVLVIANALNMKNATEKEKANKWELPTPSAFEDTEINTVVDWVKKGGSLLLIADHMPWPGANEKLAMNFGIIMDNSFVFDATFTYKKGDPNIIKFKLSGGKPTEGKLVNHAIVAGRKNAPISEEIQYVSTFTGSAFRAKPGSNVQPLMVFGDGSRILYPAEADTMSLQTPNAPAVGLLQGATVKEGDGRVAVFGEASMFTAQTAPWDPKYPMGMQNPEAANNQQFLLNVLHWLTKLL
ncbi:MAG: hypothetical protein H7833_05530 [Magnetococcus sp. DMHC-1]|nr:hypothetical protein [Magnetococcales bacterium]